MTGEVLSQRQLNRALLARQLLLERATLTIPERAKALSAPAPLDPPTGKGIYRSAVSAQEAFQAAASMANKEGPFKLSGAHVVAAVAGMEHGTVARLFDVLGLDRGAASAAAEQELQAMSTGSPGR